MFAYLNGEVAEIDAEHVVLDVGGVGFSLMADTYTRTSVSVGEKAKLHTIMRIVDDHVLIFGFAQKAQKEMFLKLVTVSGVGPKMAVAILSSLKVDEIVSAILSEDEKAFQAVSGVGKKTAQRLLLELREKVDFAGSTDQEAGIALKEGGDAARDAVEALEGLGYSHPEAIRAVSAVRNLGDTAEELVRFALKRFGAK